MSRSPFLQVCQWRATKWAARKGAVSQSHAPTVRDTGILWPHPVLCQIRLPSHRAESSKTCLFTWDPALMGTHPSPTPLWLPVNRESEKKWCRSGDWSSCVLTGSEGSYEDTSVTISDDRTRTFTVTLKNLQMRNTSWYWCLAGQNKIAVHVQVTPRPTISRLPLKWKMSSLWAISVWFIARTAPGNTLI